MATAMVFRREDGVLGVGFSLEFAGVEQLSIAWQQGAPERMTPEMAALTLVKQVGEVELVSETEGVVSETNTTNSETTEASQSSTIAPPDNVGLVPEGYQSSTIAPPEVVETVADASSSIDSI
jgi:hypothetical protein